MVVEREGQAALVARELGLSGDVVRQLGLLIGKSAEYGGGRVNLLLSHLLDTAAVAGCMWDDFLAPSVQRELDRVAGGDGRRLFMWMCGVHDCGKATPAFQNVDADNAARLRAAGLTWRASALRGKSRWRHDRAGAKILRDVLKGKWPAEAVGWMWPLVAGHHGSFPSSDVFSGRRFDKMRELHGRGEAWSGVQRALLEVFTRCLGFPDLASVQPVATPSKAVQLWVSGFVIMADWIASDTRDGRFRGLDRIEDLSLARARERAAAAWRALKLHRGWGLPPSPPDGDLVRHRFGDTARESQSLLLDLAREVPEPGVFFVEAPMGEGKTKAALAAAEVLASRFGLDGVYVGMPTQATCDPMYKQVCKWVGQFGAELPKRVALLHGKKMFNPEWRQLWERPDREEDGDPFGMDDPFASVGEDGGEAGALGAARGTGDEEDGPSEWLLGRHRGLLSPFVVGTIDQLLFAAARAKHVMLRFAGLAGKVVVVDEVHAADVYMSQFLHEALRWLGQARVPVLLLSATLPAGQRHALARAYLEGATGQAGVDTSGMPEPAGYPSVTAAYVADGKPMFRTAATRPWRKSLDVRIEWLPDISEGNAEASSAGSGELTAVAEAVRREASEGGAVLVVLNRVSRAQRVYEQLAQVFDGDVHLLHGRLCAAHRADRTESCLRALGPEAGKDRPRRVIVVATQLAEQSFDADADLLVTDLAPMDLLLQRIGRLHRHAATRRPAHLTAPRVLITGVTGRAPAPRFLGTSEAIYGRYLLLRTAACLVRLAGPVTVPQGVDGGEWSIPAQVPDLVGEVYGEGSVCPAEWQALEDSARAEWRSKLAERADRARSLVLSREGEWASPTLDGLHHSGAGFGSEQELHALVRDGEPSVEVVLVRHTARGYHALDGTPLGVHGEASEHARDSVLGGTTRLPSRPPELTVAADKELRPLDGWRHVPWLARAKALILDESGQAHLAGARISYDAVLGLEVERG